MQKALPGGQYPSSPTCISCRIDLPFNRERFKDLLCGLIIREFRLERDPCGLNLNAHPYLLLPYTSFTRLYILVQGALPIKGLQQSDTALPGQIGFEPNEMPLATAITGAKALGFP
jgi:hypothetical protein